MNFETDTFDRVVFFCPGERESLITSDLLIRGGGLPESSPHRLFVRKIGLLQAHLKYPTRAEFLTQGDWKSLSQPQRRFRRDSAKRQGRPLILAGQEQLTLRQVHLSGRAQR